MPKVLKKIVMVLAISSLLFQFNIPWVASAQAANNAALVSADASVPQHGRALGLALSDDSVKAAFKTLSQEGRRIGTDKPSFIHATAAMQNDPAAGDLYVVAFKADKDELHQAFVTAIVDVTHRSVAAATIWYGDALDEQSQKATLRMVEFRSGKITHDRWMTVDGANGKAYDEHGRELKSDARSVGLSSLWGTPAAAETISTCDAVSAVYWALSCFFVGTFFTGFIASAIVAVVCALVALVVTVWVCTQIELIGSP